MKRFPLLMMALLMLGASSAAAQTDAIQGWCETGGKNVVTSGLSSTTTVQQSYPRCTVRVYLTGTTTLATIYKDKVSTPLANPFTANTDGSWLFFAANSARYDVTMSGGTAPNVFPIPQTLTDLGNGSGGGGGGGCATGGIPTTNGLVDGDNSSTNCGYQNRINDTAGSPSQNQTFGLQLMQNNSGTDNVAMGWFAGDSNTGSINVFLGDSAGGSNTGDAQVFIGNAAGENNTGDTVVGIGENAARNNSATFSNFIGDNSGNMPNPWTAGGYWDCMGYDSCQNGIAGSGTLGSYVVGIGAFSADDAEGNYLTALGYAAGDYHTGDNVVAIGQAAGDGRAGIAQTPTAGSDIIAIGQGSGRGSGSNVVAIGNRAINGSGSTFTANSGSDQVGIGDHALTANITGAHNVAIGTYAGANGWLGNSTIGNSNTSGSNNTWIGDYSGPNTTSQLSNTIAVGYQAYNTVSNQTTIGNSSTTSLKLFGCSSGQTVYDDGSGTCYTPGSGGGTPGGSTTQIQYNNAGAFGGDSGFTTDGAGHETMKTLNVADGTGAAGLVAIKQGTAAGTVANSIGLTAPASVTAYNVKLPSAQGTGALTNDGAGNLSWTGSTFIDQLSGVNQVVPTGTSQDDITKLANAAASLNHFYYTDSTNADGWYAGLAYTANGQFVADNMLAMMYHPTYFTAAQRLAFLNHLIGAKNVNGEFPIAIALNGTSGSSSFYSSWDLHHAFAGGDGWISAPIVLWQYYQQTGDLTPYTSNVAAIKTAIAFYPENATNHLTTVVAGNEYVPCIGFMEQPRFNSDNACASVFKAFDMYVLGQMATAAGDTTNATFFNGRYTSIKSGITTEFLDGTTGMLYASSSGQNAQDDVVSTTFAIFLESQASGFSILSSGQKSTISNYLATNNTALTNQGFVRQVTADWGTVGIIPAGGGPPYNASPYTGAQYQGGYWGFPVAPYVYTLSLTSAGQALIPTLLTNYRDATNPGTEWRNVGSTAAQGTTTLLTSPMGPKWAQDHYPSPLTLTQSPMPCLNEYGVFSNSYTCGLTPTTAYPTSSIVATETGSGANFVVPDENFAPDITAGGEVALVAGKNFSSNYNSAYLGLKYAGNSSTSNGACLGMYNADNLLCAFGTGTVGVGYTTPQTPKFAVNGGSGTAADFASTGSGNAVTLTNSTVTSSNFMLSALESSLGTGNAVGLDFGQSAGTNNFGYVRFTNVGSGSAQNFVSLGLFAADDLFQIAANGTAKLKTTFTVSTLPSASTVGAGSMAIVTDATTFTPGTCTGGGSDYMLAVSNGSTWSCH